MKKNLIIAIAILIGGCSVDKDIIGKDEWSSKNDTIFYSNKAVAFYDHSEYELNPSHGRH
jgi:hypothetical protein